MMITSHTVSDSCGNGTLDEGGESPLDVLSRAATMIQQETEQMEQTNKSHLKLMTKWKRERRRLPEYSRKSDPKIPETLGAEPSSPEASLSNKSSPLGSLNGAHSPTSTGPDSPLDMTVRQRGLPPSYDQTINNPSFRSNYKPFPSPVTSINSDVPKVNNTPLLKEELPSGISMCDPVIEEHFRRSLGADYHLLFQNNNKAKELSQIQEENEPKKTKSTNLIEMTEDTEVSVDDHFAKALGETWAKLNKKDEIKHASENNLVTIKQ